MDGESGEGLKKEYENRLKTTANRFTAYCEE